EARSSIQAFVWHDFCDEYIEAVKYRLYNDDPEMLASKEAAQYSLKTVIESTLKLLSPLTPHFTEEVYQYLNPEGLSIHSTAWPEVEGDLISDEAEDLGETAVELIGDIRRFKSASKMPLNTPIKFTA